MQDHARDVFMAMMTVGFAPHVLLIVYFILTGQVRALFDKNRDVPKTRLLTLMVNAAVFSFPIFLGLVVLLVWISLA